MFRTWARYTWAAPTSALGLLLALLLSLGSGQRPRGAAVAGVLEIVIPGDAHPRWPFVAITLGHVVIACSESAMRSLRAHERVHVTQAERWGPLFVPAYLLEGLWQWLQGKGAYVDNRFEVQARALAARDAEAALPGVAVANAASAAPAYSPFAAAPQPQRKDKLNTSPRPAHENRRR